jgi:serine protease
MNTTDNSQGSNGASTSKARKRNWFWLVLLVAVALVWWFWKPPADNGRRADAEDAANATSRVYTDPDDILVDFRDDVSDAQVAALGAKYGLHLTLVSSQSHDEQFYRAHVDATQRDTLLAALAADPEIETAEPDAEMFKADEVSDDTQPAVPAPLDSGYPNDPQYKFQWHLRQIGMPEAWKMAQGDGVIVAVIDTGVAYEDYGRFHRVPDLAGVQFVKGYDFVGNTAHGNDDHGHGTHVAGTIAQATNNGIGVAGVAPHAIIMPLKVLGAGGSGSTAGIADAIRYAADNGAKVINMSLGGRFRSKILERAVKYAHDKGVVVVCAAGNDGAGRVSYPAAYPGAIAVAATQFDETTTFYSNRGKEIDVAAPGGNTQVDQNNDGMPDGVLQNTIEIGNPEKDGYFPFMGTSMASPHVAGVAALIVSAGVTEPDAVEKILKESARVPAAGPNKGVADALKYGAGIIDTPAALKAARSNAGGWQLGLGLLLAGAVAAAARKRGLEVRLGPSYLGGVVLGASGLFFLPWLGSLGERASMLPIVHTLTYGFPSWDLALLGPASHGNALFFSALVPFGLLTSLYGVTRLRGLLAGFAIGVAGHLLFHSVAGFVDVRYVPNVLMLDQMWLTLNAALCAGFAFLALRRS